MEYFPYQTPKFDFVNEQLFKGTAKTPPLASTQLGIDLLNVSMMDTLRRSIDNARIFVFRQSPESLLGINITALKELVKREFVFQIANPRSRSVSPNNLRLLRLENDELKRGPKFAELSDTDRLPSKYQFMNRPFE